MKVIDEVRRELNEMKKIGMRVPLKAFTAITESDAEEYRQNGMKISEIADMAIVMSLT